MLREAKKCARDEAAGKQCSHICSQLLKAPELALYYPDFIPHLPLGLFLLAFHSTVLPSNPENWSRMFK